MMGSDWDENFLFHRPHGYLNNWLGLLKEKKKIRSRTRFGFLLEFVVIDLGMPIAIPSDARPCSCWSLKRKVIYSSLIPREPRTSFSISPNLFASHAHTIDIKFFIRNFVSESPSRNLAEKSKSHYSGVSLASLIIWLRHLKYSRLHDGKQKSMKNQQ